jgi:hypothetical protein
MSLKCKLKKLIKSARIMTTDQVKMGEPVKCHVYQIHHIVDNVGLKWYFVGRFVCGCDSGGTSAGT